MRRNRDNRSGEPVSTNLLQAVADSRPRPTNSSVILPPKIYTPPKAVPQPLGLKRPQIECTHDVSVILGTVNRPDMLRDCVTHVRQAIADEFKHEIVVAYGAENDVSLPWMREQKDIRPILGGLNGAIEAFNRAYDASRGKYICQINDDVLVDKNSITLAVRYLEENPTCPGVVFKFDLLDGNGYRNLPTQYVHPNQMVARRSTCERVINYIGAFWGDSAHRTHPTYGGDSAFGAVCHFLGLKLVNVHGVTCRDLEFKDELRARNAQGYTWVEHGAAWWKMFGPYLGR